MPQCIHRRDYCYKPGKLELSTQAQQLRLFRIIYRIDGLTLE